EALDRDAAEVAAEPGQDLVLELVERRKIDVAAFGLDDLIMIALAQQRRDAEAGAGPDDRNDTLARERLVGTADRPELVVRQPRHRVSDGAEIVDDAEPIDPEPLLHQIGANDPRIVGEFEDLAADRTGESERQFRRQLD